MAKLGFAAPPEINTIPKKGFPIFSGCSIGKKTQKPVIYVSFPDHPRPVFGSCSIRGGWLRFFGGQRQRGGVGDDRLGQRYQGSPMRPAKVGLFR